MIRTLLTASLLMVLSVPAHADVKPFPASFRTQDIAVDGATIHTRIGGKGPAVVLLHGFGDTGDMWVPLATDLAKDHTVVIPDLRGMGLSSIPDGGYDKKTQAGDIRAVLASLGIEHSVVIGHDIGTMVAFAYASRYPQQTDRLVVMDKGLVVEEGTHDELMQIQGAYWRLYEAQQRQAEAQGAVLGLGQAQGVTA